MIRVREGLLHGGDSWSRSGRLLDEAMMKWLVQKSNIRNPRDFSPKCAAVDQHSVRFVALGPDHTWLYHPALIGLQYPEWEAMVEQLDVARHAQSEAALHQRRGHARYAAAGNGRKAVLTLEDRAAITLNQQTIHRVIKQTRALLTVIGYTPEPTGLRLATEAEMDRHVANADAVIPDNDTDQDKTAGQ